MTLLTTLEIQSIVSLPLDVFDGMLFHTEILFLGKGLFRKLKPHYTFHKNTIVQSNPENFTGLHDKLCKFVELDFNIVSVMRNIAFNFALQDKAGQLLAALIYKLDSSNKFYINKSVRSELAALINTSDQVVTNQLKSLVDSRLIIKESKGTYFFNLIEYKDIQKIILKNYDSISLETKYYIVDVSPMPIIEIR